MFKIARMGATIALALSTTFAPFAARPAPANASTFSGGGKSLDIWMLDIGQGTCVYVECPDKQSAAIVDCGSTRDSSRKTVAKVGKWLDGRIANFEHVSVVISHGDKDHYTLLPSLTEKRIDRVRFGGIPADFQAINQWLEKVAKQGGDVAPYAPNTFQADDEGFQCAPAKIDVLVASARQAFPSAAVDSRKNADSAIVRVSFDGFAVVMPGDAEGLTQKNALKNAKNAGLSLNLPTIVMGSHHGARTASSNNDEWVKSWKAPVAAFSASVDVSYRHPQCEVVGRYAQYAKPTVSKFAVPCGVGPKADQRLMQSRILSTYINGHILVRIGPSGQIILCQIVTPACDGQLDLALVP